MSFLLDENIVVGPEGDPNSTMALVGEALGRDEVIERRPFVGVAGNLLNNLLCTAGISRSQCYITNTIKERRR